MSQIKTALDALDKATWKPGGDRLGYFNAKRTVERAPPDMAAWIKKTIAWMAEARCYLADGNYEHGPDEVNMLDELYQEATK